MFTLTVLIVGITLGFAGDALDFDSDTRGY